MGTRVAVVGVGAIGATVGGQMARAGEDVTFIDMWPENVEYMREHGLQLSGITPEETYSVPVNVMHISDVQSLAKQAPIDIAFITVKSYDTQWATRLIQPYLAKHGFCVSMQNCINEERIAEVVGWGKTLGVVPLIAAELYKAGHAKTTVQMHRKGHVQFRVGEVHGRVTERAEEVARLVSTCDETKVTTNLWGERWSKLIVNAMGNGLCAVSGLGGAERDLNEITRWVRIRLGAETVRVAEAHGYVLEEMHGVMPATLARAGEGDKAALAEVTERLLENAKRRSGDNRPSMLQDIAKGRHTETDFINGYVVQKGDQIGVPAPINAKINEMVKRVERGELQPSVDNVKDI